MLGSRMVVGARCVVVCLMISFGHRSGGEGALVIARWWCSAFALSTLLRVIERLQVGVCTDWMGRTRAIDQSRNLEMGFDWLVYCLLS